MKEQEVILTVSEFVAVTNQTLEYAYPSVVITGELANFRVSKNRWVYFDLKDETASVRFFGTVYNLRGPMEDGMLLKVQGAPRLHPLYGFSVTIQQIELVGEGVIKRAADLLHAKLAAEGLFASERKRILPYPPKTIGLITSEESAAYADFNKILSARWGGLHVTLANVQVQGMAAPMQLSMAIRALNELPEPPDVLVMIRGGGSAEDLQAFSDETVVRAVAGSRIPTLVAIGHEVDVSLAELAADRRASTPSNAAELLVPDKQHVLVALNNSKEGLHHKLQQLIDYEHDTTRSYTGRLTEMLQGILERSKREVEHYKDLIALYDPERTLKRGYAVLRKQGRIVMSSQDVAIGDIVTIETAEAQIEAEVQDLKEKQE